MSYDEAGHPIGEYTYHGPVISQTLYVGDIPVAFATPKGAYFINPDHLNAPRLITDSSGNFVSFWNFVPFGERGMITSANPVTYNARFPGQYYDAESGLNNNGFRDYEPLTGRYIESDPIGLKGGINTYAYVDNNPLSYIDDQGLYVGDGGEKAARAGVLFHNALFPNNPLPVPNGGGLDFFKKSANNIISGQCPMEAFKNAGEEISSLPITYPNSPVDPIGNGETFNALKNTALIPNVPVENPESLIFKQAIQLDSLNSNPNNRLTNTPAQASQLMIKKP